MIGVYGSYALTILMGKICLDSNSDIDLLIKGNLKDEKKEIEEFYFYLTELQDKYNKRIDCELEISHGRHINLKEWFDVNAKSILVKELDRVFIVNKENIFTC